MKKYNHLDSSLLEQKIALVTAGAAGIGRTIADDLLRQGATVYVCDVNAEALAAFETFYVGEKNACSALVDVSDAHQVESFINSIMENHGRLDILVNNAGIAGPVKPVEDVGVDEWQATLAVDLDSVFFFTKFCIPLLKKSDDGVIVNMSSNAGLFGLALRSPYVAAKWAIIGLTKTWAMELGAYGIRVNAVCPGSVEGPRIDGVIKRDAQTRAVPESDIRKVYERQSSLRRFVSATDIANMVSYLVGEAGRNISGQAISIDGHTESLANWLDD